MVQSGVDAALSRQRSRVQIPSSPPKLKDQILVKVEVPSGDYCWGPGCEVIDGIPQHQICEHFDNEGGHPTCKVDFLFLEYSDLKYDKEGYVKKPEECRKLTIKE